MDAIAIWNYSNYLKDIDVGAGFHYNSNQSRLHISLNIGDSLWLITRIVIDGINQYRLVARLVVREKTINAPSYKYGAYRVWGDVKASSYYRIDDAYGQDIFELLRNLEMHKGSLLDRNRSNIFQCIQTIRNIPQKSSEVLASFAESLPLEMRAYQVLDEISLEKAYSSGTTDQLNRLLNDKFTGYSDSTKSKMRSTYERNRKLVRQLNTLYNGRCQVTGHDSPLLYGIATAEAHHLVYRSRGGQDELDNIVLVCPNLYTAIHGVDAKFDYAKLAFVFPNGRVEPLVINKHLNKRVA
jgi:5-methylcytosine-specific restriction enzyme A